MLAKSIASLLSSRKQVKDRRMRPGEQDQGEQLDRQSGHGKDRHKPRLQQRDRRHYQKPSGHK